MVFTLRRKLGGREVVFPADPRARKRVTFRRQPALPEPAPGTQVTTTSSNNDTLVCSGGSLPLRQSFTLNVRTNPGPSAGIGGQIFGRQDGQLKGPFPTSGP